MAAESKQGNHEAAGEALGLLETQGLVAALEGVDAMLKAANVRLIAQERTVPGLITSKISGETAAVRSAVDTGRSAAEKVGTVMSAHVIPRPALQVRGTLELGDARPKIQARSRPPGKRTSGSTYDAMTVAELRRLAREYDDDTFSGRVISKASKAELLAFLKGQSVRK